MERVYKHKNKVKDTWYLSWE